MNLILTNDWKILMKNEFNKSYFIDLLNFIDYEFYKYKCYPKKEFIFSALNNCLPHKIKIVIIGQDPYHKVNQANGLSFSVNKGIKIPPSLKNIFKELQIDVKKPYPLNGDLINWSKQGVLLLNSVLTVRENEPGSHKDIGWQIFTDKIISILSKRYKGIIFMLWGTFAKMKKKYINNNEHLILESGHPSPLSANRGFWFGNKHFSKSNEFLKNIGKEPIKW